MDDDLPRVIRRNGEGSGRYRYGAAAWRVEDPKGNASGAMTCSRHHTTVGYPTAALCLRMRTTLTFIGHFNDALPPLAAVHLSLPLVQRPHE